MGGRQGLSLVAALLSAKNDIVTAWDELADLYDETRGGEGRGQEYAADIDRRLRPGPGPVLEIGVGTGVVALGLRRHGWRVIGLDRSAPMLAGARRRLGPSVVRGDACRLPFADGSIANAVSVWVVHAIDNPVRLFDEVARVLTPGGRYVIATVQRTAADDPVGRIMDEFSRLVDEYRPRPVRRDAITASVLDWAAAAGFSGIADVLTRQWAARPSDEITAIRERAWPALRSMDDDEFTRIASPTLERLAAMGDEIVTRRAVADVITLERKDGPRGPAL